MFRQPRRPDALQDELTNFIAGKTELGLEETVFLSTVAAFDAFNMGPPLGTGRELSTGASYVTYTPPAGIYTVRAYDANGELPDSETLVQWGQPEKLPHYVEWSAVAGATGYRLYQWATHILTDAGFVATGAPLRYWDVGAATNWTGYPEGDGSIAVESAATPARGSPVRHVGQLSDDNGATWEAFLVAGHACQTISGAYLDGVPVPRYWILDSGYWFLLDCGDNPSGYPSCGRPQRAAPTGFSFLQPATGNGQLATAF